MKKALLLSVFTFFYILPVNAQQQIQLSTYYPAPYGRYQQIVVGESVIIQPLATPPTCDADTEGAIYVSQSAGTQLCQSGSWNPVGGFSTRNEGANTIAYIPDPVPGTAGDEPRVGIGTSTPSSALHVVNEAGDTSIRVDGNNSDVLIESGAAGRIGTITDHPLQFITGDTGTGDTTRMHITATGRVGIGTTTPTRNLEVADSMVINNATAMAEMVFRTSASEYSIGVDPSISDNFKIDLSGNTGDPYLVVTTGGEVIINGTLSVKGPTDPEKAAVKMKYVPDASSPGYYATYAP